MRKTLKFFHTIASCGLLGGFAAYAVVLIAAPQATAGEYADMRATIAAIAGYLLIPSLAVALVTGLLAMAVHRPFQELRWAWVKALLGISTFEATLGIVQSKANTAAALAEKIANGEPEVQALATAIGYEWHALGVITALAGANVVLGVWRPSLKRRRRPQAAE
jgi:hypothetical protein